MKKRQAYKIILLFLIILTSILFVVNLIQKNSKSKKEEQIEEKQEKNEIEYKANETIRVKFSKTGEIVAMDINDYLRGVVPSEMSPTYNIEALKAQALVARTYTYGKIGTGADGVDADICDNYAHCQAFYTKEKLFSIWRQKGYDEETILDFWSKINEAVVATQNEIITYNGACIKAYFHASSPLGTENVDQIWGGQSLPYLKSVDSLEDPSYSNTTSAVEISFDDFISKIEKDQQNRIEITKDQVKEAHICDYTTSGRVKNIQIGNVKVSAEKLRTLFALKSTRFELIVKEDSLLFNVIGYGHGVGMSQVGANYYAGTGMNYIDIIKHYYTGIEIKKLD